MTRAALRMCLQWLRAGYPDEASRTGYSPLLALCGPLALTSSQKDRVAHDLETQLTSAATDIDVAITKVTGQLPTPAQTRSVARALDHRAR